MKKILSVLLSGVLLLASAIPAFSVNDGTERVSPDYSCQTVSLKPRSSGNSVSSRYFFSSAPAKRAFTENFSYSCRNLLSETEKKIYDYIVNSEFGSLILVFNEEFTYEEFIDISFMKIAHAVDYDHPEMFYFNGFSYHYNWRGGDGDKYFEPGETVYSIFFYISPEDQFDETSIQTYNEAINTAVESAKERFDACTNRAELIKEIHDFICETATFDDDYVDDISRGLIKEPIQVKHSVAGCFADGGLCVCQGYADTFKMICNMYHIPCLTPVSEDHMWNAVELDDGKWYVVDATWDDQLGSSEFLLRAVNEECYGGVFGDTHYLSPTDMITLMNLPYATVGFNPESYVDTRFKIMKNVAEITKEKILVRSVSDLGDDVYYNGLYRETDNNMGFTAPSGKDHTFENWKYLYLGDTDLNEEFGIEDFSLMVNNVLGEAQPETSLHFWANDVNMDGVLDVLDLSVCERALNSGHYIQVVPAEVD